MEDVPADELAAALESGRFRASASADICAGFDVAVITVPTPLRDGQPDLAYVEAASRTLARFLRPGGTVIVESTPTREPRRSSCRRGWKKDPGWAQIRTSTLATARNASTGKPYLDADHDAEDRIGHRRRLAGRGGELLPGIVDKTVAVSSPREAELAKLIENTFRHVNIALMNELAMFERELGVNVREAIDTAATKPFGYMRFSPGPEVGRHRLPIDPSYPSWRVERTLG